MCAGRDAVHLVCGESGGDGMAGAIRLASPGLHVSGGLLPDGEAEAGK
jgi:hypothetical protein